MFVSILTVATKIIIVNLKANKSSMTTKELYVIYIMTIFQKLSDKNVNNS